MVEVQRVGAYINKDRTRSAKDEGIRGGRESERGKEYFIPGLQIKQKGRKVQCMSARGGQKDLGIDKFALKEGLTSPTERAVTGRMHLLNRFFYVEQFPPGWA
jgi:hypothetical protein